MSRVGLFIATCGYLGYVPVAPGTFGSAAGLALFFLLRHFGSTSLEVATIAVLFVVGIWSATAAEHQFGRIDPAPVVLDEVVGMLITLAFLPVTVGGATRRLPGVPHPRCHQAVAIGSIRVAARRARSHGR